MIAALYRSYEESEEEVLRRYNRGNQARPVLLYLASAQYRGFYSLTELATRLGPISLGALTQANETLQEKQQKDAILKHRIESVVGALQNQIT